MLAEAQGHLRLELRIINPAPHGFASPGSEGQRALPSQACLSPFHPAAGGQGDGRSHLGKKSHQELIEQCRPRVFNCLACAGLPERLVPSRGEQGRGASYQLADGTGVSGTLALNLFCPSCLAPARMGTADVSLPALPGAGTRQRRCGTETAAVAKAPRHRREDAGKAGKGKTFCDGPPHQGPCLSPVQRRRAGALLSGRGGGLPRREPADNTQTPSPGSLRSRKTLQTR